MLAVAMMVMVMVVVVVVVVQGAQRRTPFESATTLHHGRQKSAIVSVLGASNPATIGH